jgi:hypothetical protein
MERIMAERVRRAACGTFVDPHRGQEVHLDGHTMVAAPPRWRRAPGFRSDGRTGLRTLRPIRDAVPDE